MKSNFENIFFKETKSVIESIDQSKLSKIIKLLINLRKQNGRLLSLVLVEVQVMLVTL